MSSLKEVTISENITEIPYYAFLNCTKLSKITLPKKVMSKCCQNQFYLFAHFEMLVV